MRYDAVVIGAGPAGASTALILAREGWSVAVVEKAAFPRRKVCGEFMSATNAPLFAELGLSHAISEAAGPEIRRVGLFARDAEIAAPMPNAASGWGRALGREILDSLLLERAAAAGATVWQPWSAVRHRLRDDGLGVCTIASKHEERDLVAPVVIAAHGSWERGTLPTQIARDHRASDLLGFKAHFRNGKLPPDLLPLLVFPGGYGGMVNSDGGRTSLTCCVRRDALDGARRRGSGSAADAVLRHVTGSCVGVERALDGAILDGSWLAAGPLHPGIRDRFANGIFRVGNVAAEAHPIIAEGISMAMQSGWLAARHLISRADDVRRGHCLGDVGQAYSAAWRSRFAPRIRAASWFANVALQPAAVTALLPLFKRAPTLLTWGASLSGKAQPARPALLLSR